MNESTEKSVLEKVVATIKDVFVPDNTPFGKKKHDQVGNNLFQSCVAEPYAKAKEYQKALGPRVLTPAQSKRKKKNRAKRKLRR